MLPEFTDTKDPSEGENLERFFVIAGPLFPRSAVGRG